MNVKQISINIWRLLKKENTVDMIFKVYLKRFKKYAFTEGQCVGYEQYEAVITKLYHSIEKGLAFEEYRPGFGEKNIDKLIRKMEQYSCQYDVEAFFYRTALSVLKEYVAKNEKYGLKDEKLKGRIDNLLGKSNYEGGIFQFTKSDILTVQNKKFDEFIKSRHSIRHFSNIPVELDKIKDAIKLAQLTP